MDVKCNNCSTEYSLDETLVAAKGTTVRCTSCSQVFKVYRSTAVVENEDKWLLRQVGGATYTFHRMGVLQQWISEGKVGENDLLSRSDGPWKRLGDLPEMQPFFSTAISSTPVAAGFPRAETSEHDTTKKNTHLLKDAYSQIQDEPQDASPYSQVPMARTNQPGDEPSRPPMAQPTTLQPSQAWSADPQPPAPQMATPAPQPIAPPVAPQPQPEAPPAPQLPSQSFHQANATDQTMPVSEPDLSQIPADPDEGSWDKGESIQAEKAPAWAEKGASPLPYDSDEDILPPPKPKVGRWVALVIIVALLGSGVYIFGFQREKANRIVGSLLGSSDDNRYKKFLDRGRESFLLDSDAYYRQADREFQKVLALKDNHAPTLAALAEMYAIWAQYFRDAELDARADALHAEANKEADLREAERLHREFKEKLAEAVRWGEQALAANPTPPEAHRAMADVKRLLNKQDAAKTHLVKARSVVTSPETSYVGVLLDQEAGKPKEKLADKLKSIIKTKPLIRAMYRQARIMASQGQGAKAKSVLKALFELNSDHLRGRDLIARIDEGKPIVLTESALSDPIPVKDADSAEAVEDADDGAKDQAATQAEKPTRKGGAGDKSAKGSGGFVPKGGVDSMLTQASRMQENGRTGNAVELYKKVLERSPSNIDALSGLAYCYLDKGSKGKAIAHFRRALKANSSFGPALLGLAETFKSQGQKEQALKYYKQYISRNPSGRQIGIAKRNATLLEQQIGPVEDKAEPDPNAPTSDTPQSDTPTSDTPTSDTPAPIVKEAPVKDEPSGSVPQPIEEGVITPPPSEIPQKEE